MSETGLGDRPPGAPDFEMPMKNPDKDKGEESLGAREDNIPYEPGGSGGPGGGSTPPSNGIWQNIKAGVANFAGVVKSKKGATGTIIAILGISGGGMAAFSPIANIGLKESPVNTLDTSHRIMAPRTPKILMRLTSGNTGGAPEGSLQDKMNSPTKKLLRSYTRAGAIPMDGNTPIDPKTLEGRGKPDVNPTHYNVDGQRVEPANIDNFMNEQDNVKFKNRVLGRNGSMNMTQRQWNDSARKVRKVHKPLNLSRKGGVADDSNSTAEEKRDKFKKKLPGNEKSNSVRSNVTGKYSKHVGKFSKGGAAAQLAAGACIAIKLPRIITGAVAAVQLLQLLPFSTDLLLSPNDKQKGSLVNDLPPEDVSGFMDPLTDVYEDEETGVKGSALDSKILLQAMGLVTMSLGVSRFAPGYSMMNNPVVQASAVAESEFEDVCNVLLSPAGMYAMMATDLTVRALTGPLSLVFGVGQIVASEILMPLVVDAATKAALENSDAIIEALGNKELIDAVGIPLGDAIGTSLIALFSLSSLTQLGPAAAEANIPEASQIINDQIAEERQMEIASLSPFDTSSRWTFLGSIVYNLNASMLVSGQYKNPALSIIPTIFGQVSTLLSTSKVGASAEETRTALMNVMYRNADECGMGGDTVNGNPAVTSACTPVSLPFEELNSMEPEEAIQIITDEGWINPDIIPENYDPDTMVSSGFIVPNTWLHDYIVDRDELFSGDYLFSTAGYRVDIDSAADAGGDNSNQVAESTIQTINNPGAKTAAMVFLQDIQVMNILNGDDDPAYMENDTAGGMIDPMSGATGAVDPNGWASPVEPGNVTTSGYGPRNGPFNGNEFHDGLDLAPTGAAGTAVFAVRDGTVSGVVTGYGGGWGNNISIDHGEVAGLGHIYSFYAHLASINVSPGQQVTAGQQIGVMGTTGSSTGVHLHFGIYKVPPGVSDKDGSTTYDPTKVVPPLGGG